MRALIYHLPLGEMDGTSVVLRRIYAQEAAHVRQLYFRTGRFPVPPTFPVEYARGDSNWPWARGARFVQRGWRKVVLPGLLRRSPWIAQTQKAVAENTITSLHVVVYDEPTAEFARRALDTGNLKRFTLHLMDLLLDNDELSPSATPHLCWLLSRAQSLVVVSNRLHDLIRPFTTADTLIWPIPAGFSPLDRQPPADNPAPWQVLISGAMYAGKTGFLEHIFLPAWKQFQQTHPHTELVYMGKDLDGIPPSVRACLRPLGVVPQEKLVETLRAASVALLPVLHEASTPWRYSVPARISDYLAAGLPVIAPHTEGTATHDFLLQVGSPAASLVAQQEDVLATLTRLHDAPGHWLTASHAATAFARQHLDLEKLRAQLFAFMA
ncbi:hypothetical protein CMV30_15440 [Nibricoccus aquaticus]|uniref:Glycosyltransferase subfamily 4-like N-terminal domain-containing protein n=1 Tax=Nibricoccus aquaticus TaxID=2576891 RepID=A0A290Q949_9BACT|nr:glycosyltransferase [Nibricoccus aquaticus]ATC65235.1 hypothetical protein CMV30_15440 [Nibricoccus aquaticus]